MALHAGSGYTCSEWIEVGFWGWGAFECLIRNGGDGWTGMQVPVVGAGYIGGLNVFGSADGRGYFLAGASHGQLFLGHADGSDWKAYESGISGGDIKAAEAAGSHWLAGGLNGAWFSKDAGASWLRSTFVHNAAVEPHGFAFSPTNSDSAWCVGTNMYAKALVFRTSDAGRIWRDVDALGSLGPVWDLQAPSRSGGWTPPQRAWVWWPEPPIRVSGCTMASPGCRLRRKISRSRWPFSA